MKNLDESENLPQSHVEFVQNKKSTKKVIVLLLFILLCVVSVYLLFVYVKAQKELSYLKDPTAKEEVVKAENDKLIRTIGKLIELPADEEPVVGTVQDAATLAKDQQFFANAKNGDRVLIYKNKAVIYRPEINKLINVGPVYVNSSSTEQISNNK